MRRKHASLLVRTRYSLEVTGEHHRYSPASPGKAQTIFNCATFPHFAAACPRTLCQHVASPPWQHETILRTTVRSEKSKSVSAASSEHLMEASLAHPFFVRKQLKE